MDSVTTNRERLEYAKVCVEVEASDEIPKFIDILLRDGSVHPVRVVTSWLLPSCPKCKVFGHAEKTCASKGAKLVQVWRQKAHANEHLNSVSEPGSSSGVKVADSGHVLGGAAADSGSIDKPGSAVDVIVDSRQDKPGGAAVLSEPSADETVPGESMVQPVVSAELHMTASLVELNVDGLADFAANDETLEADFPTLQASVQKKKGGGVLLRRKKILLMRLWSKI
ncbi:hypothetical protein HRI_003736600 [Hibiscus trionum]|uniref:DUF4283 domain-containing protein n=1 Tax=Hibiscus trionum TaxID=183268 RepID=A0A9W7IVE6_HIBTR|nr:hypothetical protein HRI_003736600 [Hibiscus trionum]